MLWTGSARPPAGHALPPRVSDESSSPAANEDKEGKKKKDKGSKKLPQPKRKGKKQKQDDGHSEEEEEEDAEHAPLGELGYDDDDELDDPTGNDTNNGKNPKGEKASKKTGAGKTSVKKKPCTRTGKKRPDHEERLLLFQLSVLCFVMGFNG